MSNVITYFVFPLSLGILFYVFLAILIGRRSNRPRIVCLCGSTRFMDAFFEAGWEFTLKGYIVLSVGVCKHADKNGAHGAEMLGEETVKLLDELHLRKIDLADEVFILNVGGYIGESTSRELEYAKKLGKTISYLQESGE